MEEVKTIILKDVLPFVDPVARSHARRVLKDAEGYKELVIDFRGIEFMGRGFADEVFRVFQEASGDKDYTASCKHVHVSDDSPSRRKTTINDIYRFLVNRYNRKSGHLSLISYYIEEKEQGKWGFI